ncbi:MAG: hypothetical protein M1368_10930 [Thaumarchaeota archaeon]|nr:hypothetical protein [Nitrososphaerota archaeon]
MDIRGFAAPPRELMDYFNLTEQYCSDPAAFNKDEWEKKQNEFITFYTSLYKTWYPRSKQYDDAHVAGQIFKKQLQTKDLRSYYMYQMYAFLKTLERLNDKIAINVNKKKDDHLKRDLEFARELIIEGIEYINSVSFTTEGKSRNYGIGKRGLLNSKELFDTAEMLLYQDYNLKRLGGFVLSPSSTMVLRQAIEIRLRSIYGIRFIYEQDGRLSKIPQKFFLDFTKLQIKNKNVQFPIEVVLVEHIFDWTQSYVHLAIMKQSWEIEWAFFLIRPLFEAGKADDGTWNYLGAVRVRKSLIDNLVVEISSALHRDATRMVKLIQNKPEATTFQ